MVAKIEKTRHFWAKKAIKKGKTIFFRKKTHFFCEKVWRFKNKSYLCIAIEKQTSVTRTQKVQNTTVPSSIG